MPFPVTPPTWVSYMPAVGPALAWLTAVLGWVIVSRDNNKREDRREVRSTLDTIVGAVNALEDKATQYYAMDVSDESRHLEMEIKRDLKVLEAKIKRLAATDPRFQHLQRQSAFHNVLTGGDFEQSARTARPHTDGKMIEIYSEARELIETLETVYVEKYHTRFSFHWPWTAGR